MAERDSRIGESTIARMAGNIAGDLFDPVDLGPEGNGQRGDDGGAEIRRVARIAVRLARAIAEETERTRPAAIDALARIAALQAFVRRIAGRRTCEDKPAECRPARSSRRTS